MARALIVGCGCRGRELGANLLAGGWAVRGTTRDEGRLGGIEEAGIEAAVAHPDRVMTILELIGDVAIVCWLLGTARGSPEELAAIHGPRFERLLEELVDTPVRGIVYETAGTVPSEVIGRGEQALREASERWRIPFALIGADPGDPAAWLDEAEAAVGGLVS